MDATCHCVPLLRSKWLGGEKRRETMFETTMKWVKAEKDPPKEYCTCTWKKNPLLTLCVKCKLHTNTNLSTINWSKQLQMNWVELEEGDNTTKYGQRGCCFMVSNDKAWFNKLNMYAICYKSWGLPVIHPPLGPEDTHGSLVNEQMHDHKRPRWQRSTMRKASSDNFCCGLAQHKATEMCAQASICGGKC